MNIRKRRKKELRDLGAKLSHVSSDVVSMEVGDQGKVFYNLAADVVYRDQDDFCYTGGLVFLKAILRRDQ